MPDAKVSAGWREWGPAQPPIPNEQGEIHVKRNIDGPSTVDDHIAAIRSAAEGLRDAAVDAEQQWDCTVIVVEGWRPATPEEIAAGERYAAHLKEMGLIRARALLQEAGEL